ncbi:zona pellucida sperm-binding protein 3-like isoform X2 [Ictalurus furcatus]|uniref:zona pellucida sperm-binding protein 3-like isoform X2 n=1 Tax=Ictalurus furcatus TaxID=66913 RepID=UPI00234FDA27|nr:zona pellucida sperm-binding protein 3-like isoform X2 [Ictalurus furcatus]
MGLQGLSGTLNVITPNRKSHLLQHCCVYTRALSTQTFQLVSDNWLIYSNKLVFSHETHLTWGGVHVLKHPPTIVPIECRYKRKFRVSAEPLSPTWLPMTSTIEAVGLLHFSLDVIKGSLHQSTVYQQGEPLLLEAAVHSPMHRPLRIYVDLCEASVHSDTLSWPRYEFISAHGCLIDSMFPYSSSKFYSRPKQNILRFSIQAFFFPQYQRKQVFISCHLRAAPVYSLPDSQNKACYFHGPSLSWHAVEGSSNVCLCCETATCKSGKEDTSSKYLDEQTRVVGPLQILPANVHWTGKLTIGT